jgi:hypothetical protein
MSAPPKSLPILEKNVSGNKTNEGKFSRGLHSGDGLVVLLARFPVTDRINVIEQGHPELVRLSGFKDVRRNVAVAGIRDVAANNQRLVCVGWFPAESESKPHGNRLDFLGTFPVEIEQERHERGKEEDETDNKNPDKRAGRGRGG